MKAAQIYLWTLHTSHCHDKSGEPIAATTAAKNRLAYTFNESLQYTIGIYKSSYNREEPKF